MTKTNKNSVETLYSNVSKRMKGQSLNLKRTKSLGKTSQPSSTRYLECKECEARFYSLNTETLYAHYVLEHQADTKIIRNTKLINLYNNFLTNETTKVIELICPNTSCSNKQDPMGQGHGWVTEFHWKKGLIMCNCPQCFTIMIPKREWEKLK